jgi:hypothetical protein
MKQIEIKSCIKATHYFNISFRFSQINATANDLLKNIHPYILPYYNLLTFSPCLLSLITPYKINFTFNIAKRKLRSNKTTKKNYLFHAKSNKSYYNPLCINPAIAHTDKEGGLTKLTKNYKNQMAYWLCRWPK